MKTIQLEGQDYAIVSTKVLGHAVAKQSRYMQGGGLALVLVNPLLEEGLAEAIMADPELSAMDVPAPEYDWDHEVVSVWIEGLQDGEISVKEHDLPGMFNILQAAGLLEPMQRRVRSGFVDFPVSRPTEAYAKLPMYM